MEKRAPAGIVTNNYYVSSVRKVGSDMAVEGRYSSTKQYKDLSKEQRIALKFNSGACRYNTVAKRPKWQDKINNNTKQIIRNVYAILETVQIGEEEKPEKGKDDDAK